MYKIHKNILGEESQVIRLSDTTYIPFDPANIDYQAYLKWLEAGNVPEPADTQGAA
jgi:hypothetical protein